MEVIDQLTGNRPFPVLKRLVWTTILHLLNPPWTSLFYPVFTLDTTKRAAYYRRGGKKWSEVGFPGQLDPTAKLDRTI
jgi:hypothetical protein